MVKYLLAPLAILLVGWAPAAAGAPTLVEALVAFEVVNTNTSLAPCPADGLGYTVRGSLVAPAGFDSEDTLSATLHLHGFDGGAWQFRGAGLPEYDHLLALAEAGHVAIAIDLVGFDASGFPDGQQACFGSAADVTHQVLQRLRSGEWDFGGRNGVAFDNVVLAGHDVGGAIAQIEAYSWDDIDGLVVVEWADQGFTPEVLAYAADAGERCGSGGERSEDGSAPHYTLFGPPDEVFAAETFHKADAAAITAFIAERNRNPCAWIQSPLTSLVVDNAGVATIEVPTLLVYPEVSPIFTPEGQALQQARYGRSTDVETVVLPDTGHWIMFEANRQLLVDTMDTWLCRQGMAPTTACAEPSATASDETDALAGPKQDAPDGDSPASALEPPARMEPSGLPHLPRSGGFEAATIGLALAFAVMLMPRQRRQPHTPRAPSRAVAHDAAP